MQWSIVDLGGPRHCVCVGQGIDCSIVGAAYLGTIAVTSQRIGWTPDDVPEGALLPLLTPP